MNCPGPFPWAFQNFFLLSQIKTTAVSDQQHREKHLSGRSALNLQAMSLAPRDAQAFEGGISSPPWSWKVKERISK